MARTRLQGQTPRPDVAPTHVGWERYPAHSLEVSCTWLCSQSSFAGGGHAACRGRSLSQGRHADVQSVCRKIVKGLPGHFDALHLRARRPETSRPTPER
jgi:hypothetical protein